MDYNVIAGNILKNVGGAQNVADVTHCFTRLRIVLKNKELANKEIVEKLEGVNTSCRSKRTVSSRNRYKG